MSDYENNHSHNLDEPLSPLEHKSNEMDFNKPYLADIEEKQKTMTFNDIDEG